MTTTDTTAIDEAVDNDIVLKAVRFGATDHFWEPDLRIGVLGAARFVVRSRLERLNLVDSRPTILDELAKFLGRVRILEPTEEELLRAAELEREAQQRLLPVDAGETQLASMVVGRAIAIMSTGDKRAIASLEQLIESVSWLSELCGRVRCLEQLVLGLVRDGSSFEELAGSVCSDVDADKTLAICFSCHSGGPNATDVVEVEQGLLSYVSALRRDAPQVLAPES